MRLDFLCFIIAISTFISCTKDTPKSIGAIYSSEEFSVYTDSVVQGDLVVKIDRAFEKRPITDTLPQYHSDQPLIDALYAMAIQEISATEHFHDIAYSTYLSLASIIPAKALAQLESQIKDTPHGYIILQKDGTGGSWPVTTDRVAWAMAIWEIYKTTGDKTILPRALHAIENTLNCDMRAAWDDRYKLMHGEMTHAETGPSGYPSWMQPVDIYESMSLGTNAMFAKAFNARDSIWNEIGDKNFTPMWIGIDKEIANSLNTNLWIPKSSFYGQYLYGGFYPVLSQANDNLGQALAIIFDIANPEMAKSIISNTPYAAYGISPVFPLHCDSASCSNWNPVTQAFWNIASAKARNMHAVEKGLAAALRGGAIYAAATNPHFKLTGNKNALPSGLSWSSAGMAAIIHRVIMGMDFTAHAIRFNPIVPNSLPGEKTLSGFKYRNADITVKLYGTGESVKTFTVNGVPQSDYSLSDTVTGKVTIEITMDNRPPGQSRINNSQQRHMPPMPVIQWTSSDSGIIRNHTEGITYMTFLNGSFIEEISTDTVSFNPPEGYSTMEIVPVSDKLYSGFMNKPHEHISPDAVTIIPSSKMSKTGTALINDRRRASRFVESTVDYNTALYFNVYVKDGGDYLFDVSYANGSGPVTDGDKCAIRMLYIDGAEAGPIVMPQRGTWEETGFSNMIHIRLKSGVNHLVLRHDIDNMNCCANTTLIEYARIIRQ